MIKVNVVTVKICQNSIEEFLMGIPKFVIFGWDNIGLSNKYIRDTPSASSSLTKSFLSESEEALSAGGLSRRGDPLPTNERLRPTLNFQCERGEEKNFQSGQLLFMGGGSSKEKLEHKNSTSDGSESVIVGKTSFGKLSEEIVVFNQKFGWYDSTDTDLTELNVLRKRKESDTTLKIEQKSCVKIDKNIEAKYSTSEIACENPSCLDVSAEEDTIEEIPDFTNRDKKEVVFKVSVSTSTSDCLNCFSISAEDPNPTITTTCVSHESTQTVSNSQMNIDKKRNSVDRYSREPPERDQSYDNGRYCTDHTNCRCPCKPDCKVTRPPEYQHSHNPHGPVRYHSPQHSSHMPSQNQHTPCPPIPHSMQSQSSYTNHQYNQSYQEYQQFPQLQSSQSQPSSQGFKPPPSYSASNQQQPRRAPPPSNFDRKRTTYDLAKSAENIRHSDHSKINNNIFQSQSIFNSVPEVGKNKSGKHDMSKSESSDNYCCNDYPNSSTHKYPYEEPNQDRTENHDRNCACDYCHHMRRNYYRNCTCCECRKTPYEELSSFSEESQNIPQNMKQRNYQKSDGYHPNELPDELETTISQRNKERVRNTMRQFEMLSRQNKSLEKPIYDDEDDEDHCNMRHCPRNLSPCFNRCNERCSDRCPDRCNIQSRNVTLTTRSAFSATPFPRSKGEQTNSRWQMDPRTGEWYKVYDDGNYDFHNNYPPLPDPPMAQFREQDEYNKGPSNSYYNPPPPIRNSSPTKHHHYPTHSKTCNCRNCTPHRY
nr:uncharacterized protein LOC111425731 isoform X3 [Onthophagus taurus]